MLVCFYTSCLFFSTRVAKIIGMQFVSCPREIIRKIIEEPSGDRQQEGSCLNCLTSINNKTWWDQTHCFAPKLVSPDAGLYPAEGRDWWGGTPPLVYTGHQGFTYHRSVWGPAAGGKGLQRPAAIIWSHGATKGWAAADRLPTSGPESWLLKLCDCSNCPWQETAASDWKPLLTQTDCANCPGGGYIVA